MSALHVETKPIDSIYKHCGLFDFKNHLFFHRIQTAKLTEIIDFALITSREKIDFKHTDEEDLGTNRSFVPPNKQLIAHRNNSL